MTYRQEMGRLARELGNLLVEGGRVPSADVPAAITAHASVVGLLRAVHADLVRAEWTGAVQLGKALFAQPTPTQQTLNPAPAGAAASTAGERWRNVGEWSRAAQYEWHRSTLASRPHGGGAWSEVADVASLSEAIGQLDGDLADSLAEAGRWSDARDFRRAQPELLDIAQKVRVAAATGPLPALTDLEPALPGEVLLVPTPEAVPAALERLSSLITSTEHLPPGQVDLISRVVAETATTAASALHQAGDPAVDVLLEHARRLSVVTGLSRRIAPLRLGSGDAAVQAQRVHHLLRALRLRGTSLPPQVARDAARTLPSITKALTASVERQITSGLWLISRTSNGALRWTAPPGTTDEIPLLERLRNARQHAESVTRAVDQPSTDTRPKQRPAPIPRKVLAGPLSHRGSPVPMAQAWETLHRNR